MKKKGFTLVELLGVIVILAIIMGLAVVAYININESTRKTYYKGVEEAILISVGDYFTYNPGKVPQMYGDVKTVTLKELVENKYIEKVVDQKGKECNLEESYVLAYKNSYQKNNYGVCLICNGKYELDNEGCNGVVSYNLGVSATVKDTVNRYIVDSWVSGYVTLTFKTYNDIKTVSITSTNGENKSCNLVESGGIKSCKVQIDKTGVYTYYGIGESGDETGKESITINIDNTAP